MTDTAGFRTDWSTTSFSELSTLAHCEEKWYRRYVLREPSESGPAANTGTFFHAGTATLLKGGLLEDALLTLDDEVELAYPEGVRSDAEIKSVTTASWLIQRYARHYAKQLAQIELVESEFTVERDLHYPTRDGWQKVTIKGTIDSLLNIDGKLWLREAKTSGRKDVLDTAQVSPQITLYWWLLEENLAQDDLELYGVLFDYAYTYRWKATKPTQKELVEAAVKNDTLVDGEKLAYLSAKDQRTWAQSKVASHPGIERPDSESFEQIWLDRNPGQVEAGVQWAQDILERRHHLTRFIPGVDRAPVIKNISPACKFCDHKTNCYGSLAFPQDEISLVLD